MLDNHVDSFDSGEIATDSVDEETCEVHFVLEEDVVSDQGKVIVTEVVDSSSNRASRVDSNVDF